MKERLRSRSWMKEGFAACCSYILSPSFACVPVCLPACLLTFYRDVTWLDRKIQSAGQQAGHRYTLRLASMHALNAAQRNVFPEPRIPSKFKLRPPARNHIPASISSQISSVTLSNKLKLDSLRERTWRGRFAVETWGETHSAKSITQRWQAEAGDLNLRETADTKLEISQ